MKYSFQSLVNMKYLGIGFSNKGEIVYWYSFIDRPGYVGLTARKSFVEYREDNPTDDFDFIAANELDLIC